MTWKIKKKFDEWLSKNEGLFFYKILKKCVDFIYDYSGIIAPIGGVILSIVDISQLKDAWHGSLYGGAVLFTIITTVLSVEKTFAVNKLIEKNADQADKIQDYESTFVDIQADIYSLLGLFLKVASDTLGFNTECRISLYKHTNKGFFTLGRHSGNPEWSNNSRPYYPIGEGFIGKAWRDEEFDIENLPDPNQDFEAYYAAINTIPIDRASVEAMKMQSRSYCVRRINGFDGRPKAIMVFESVNPTIDIAAVDNYLETNKDYIIMMVENIKFTQPNSIAENSGF